MLINSGRQCRTVTGLTNLEHPTTLVGQYLVSALPQVSTLVWVIPEAKWAQWVGRGITLHTAWETIDVYNKLHRGQVERLWRFNSACPVEHSPPNYKERCRKLFKSQTLTDWACAMLLQGLFLFCFSMFYPTWWRKRKEKWIPQNGNNYHCVV